MITKDEFISEIKRKSRELRKLHPEYREGQAIFNTIDSDDDYFGVARQVQFKYNLDCFFDKNIDEFLDKCYEEYQRLYYNMPNTEPFSE